MNWVSMLLHALLNLHTITGFFPSFPGFGLDCSSHPGL